MTEKTTPPQHLLENLRLPDRYERLVEALGHDVANLLVRPPQDIVETLESLTHEIGIRGEGILVPLTGRSGTGKTTLAMNASHWHPSAFTATYLYEGEVVSESLQDAVKAYEESLPADNKRIIPINIDHRESNPPTDREMAEIKRFLRTSKLSAPCIIFWPETDAERARDISRRYIEVAGAVSVELPLNYAGPDPATWVDVAVHTLSLANAVEDLEQLGVDPRNYDPTKFRTLGDFMRRLSHDFNSLRQELRKKLHCEISVIIAFASSSTEPGVLSQLTGSHHYGLFNAHSLIAVTKQSEIGKWWDQRRGLLTRAIVQLDVRGVCLPPAASCSCIRNFTDEMPIFDTVGYRRYGPSKGARDLSRCDLGKLIAGKAIDRFEARGTPAEEAGAAFELLAERGFNLGKDKGLNKVMADALARLLSETGVAFDRITSEQKLDTCALIPDNTIYSPGRAMCVEYTWRKGDFLASGNRSGVAQYVLTKLQHYIRQLGWTDD